MLKWCVLLTRRYCLLMFSSKRWCDEERDQGGALRLPWESKLQICRWSLLLQLRPPVHLVNWHAVPGRLRPWDQLCPWLIVSCSAAVLHAWVCAEADGSMMLQKSIMHVLTQWWMIIANKQKKCMLIICSSFNSLLSYQCFFTSFPYLTLCLQLVHLGPPPFHLRFIQENVKPHVHVTIESISAVDFSPSNRWLTLPTPCTMYPHPSMIRDRSWSSRHVREVASSSFACRRGQGTHQVFFFSCLLLVELSILTWGNSLFDIKKVSHSFLWHLKFFLFLIWHPNYVLFPFWHHRQFCYFHRQIILSRTKLPSLHLPCPDPICGYDREQAAILQFRYST